MSNFDPYVTEEPPQSPDDLSQYLSRELRRIENSIAEISKRHTAQIIDATANASSAENIFCNASAGPLVLVLPGASGSLVTSYSVWKTKGTYNVIVRSTETINGAGSSTLSAVYQNASFVTDGKEWFQK